MPNSKLGRDKPNILLVTTDQQHPDLIGALNKINVKTPAIDQFSKEGVLFSRAYVTCPLCTPSRASLLTGQYPSRHRAWSIGTYLSENSLSLPNILAEEAGYSTAIIGKSHFKSALDRKNIESPPMSRDWDYFAKWNGPWYGFQYARINTGHVYEKHAYSMHYGLWLKEQGIDPKPPYFSDVDWDQKVHWDEGAHPIDNSDGLWALPEKYHTSQWVADETISYLKKHNQNNSGAPFYVCVNFPDPHAPFLVPEPWNRLHENVELPVPIRRRGEWEGKPTLYRATIKGDDELRGLGWHDKAPIPSQYCSSTESEGWTKKEKRDWRTYMGMQSLVDKHFGRILNTLEKLDLAENTIVIFTSDHGDNMGNHFLWAKGGSHYDGAIRIPFIIRWPRHIQAGARSNSLLSLVDLPVTLMTAAGLEIHPDMQGINQLDVWQEPGKKARSSVLIDHLVEKGIYVNTLVTQKYRLSVHSIFAENRDEVELYDLEKDPAEFENIASQNNELTSRLLQELIRYRGQIMGPWQQRDYFA